MKKIVLTGVAAALCTTLLNAQINDYKSGFESAIEAFRLQVKLNNIVPEKIVFENETVVFINIDKLDTASVMLLQYLAEKEDFKDVKLGQNKIFLGSYERMADVLHYQKKAEKLFGEKVYFTNRKELANEYTNTLFLKDVYKRFENKGSQGVVIVKEPIYIASSTPNNYIKPVRQVKTKKAYKSSVKTKWPLKTIKIKNEKAQAYYLPTGWEDGSYRQSQNFLELDIRDKDTKYRYARTLRSSDGKVFIKVYDENVYFLREDIRIFKGYNNEKN